MPDTTGKRCEARLRTRLPARLIARQGECRAVLLDLSRHGCRLSYSGFKAKGEVVIQWFNFEAFGEVVREGEGLIGVHFLEPIEEEWLVETRSIDDARHLPSEEGMLREDVRAWVSGEQRV